MKRLFKHVTNSVGWQLYGPNEVANGLDFESVGFVPKIVAWPVWVVVLVFLHVVGAATVILSLAVLTIVIPILGPLKLRMLAKRALESRRRAEEMRAEVVPLRARAWLAELGVPDCWDGLRAVWRRTNVRDAVSVLVMPNDGGGFVTCKVSWDDSVSDKYLDRVCASAANLRLTLRRIVNGHAFR